MKHGPISDNPPQYLLSLSAPADTVAGVGMLQRPISHCFWASLVLLLGAHLTEQAVLCVLQTVVIVLHTLMV